MIRQVAESSTESLLNFCPQEQTRVVTTHLMLDPTTVRLLRPNAILLRRK
jgi:hypothetical protein